MNLPPDPDEAPAPDEEKFVTLHSDYDNALIGITVRDGESNRFTYSLELLVAIVMAQESVGRAMAMANIQTMMRGVWAAEGDRSPVFVDDQLRVDRQNSEGVKKIVMPGDT